MSFFSIIRSADRISGVSSNCNIELFGYQELPVGALLKCTAKLFLENDFPTTTVYVELISDNFGIINVRDTSRREKTILFHDVDLPKALELNCTNFTKKIVNFQLLNSNGTTLQNDDETTDYTGNWILYLKCEEIKVIN